MQLALETSTNICSVAFKDARGIVHEKRTEVRGSHSEQLFLFVDELKKEHGFDVAELDAVIVSEGPGSYTGLRISASAVKGLLFQSKVPLFAANTLASFAAAAYATDNNITTIHSIIDARRVHVYHQKFEIVDGQISSAGKVMVMPIADFEDQVKSKEAIIGTGIKRINNEAISSAKIFEASYISAKSLFQLQILDKSSVFIKERDIQRFDPKYYSSNQVNNSK